MKSKFAKVRTIAGLFLEALMLVFIFACVDGELMTTDTSEEEDSSKGIILSCTLALSSNSASQAFYILHKNQTPDNDTFSLSVDFHGICVVLSKALSVGQFERNTFYIASADNIP